MTNAERARYSKVYRDGLLDDTLPFWFPRCIDAVHGGFMTAVDRDGTVIDTDKCLWQQGRASWLLSTLFNTVEARPEWLEWSRQGIDFFRRCGFDTDGQMYFQVTRDGRPLRKRRYVFSEAFAAMACAAYAKAAGDDASAVEARQLFANFLRCTRTPGLLAPKTDPVTRPMRGLVQPMIAMCVAQVLRDNLADEDGALAAEIDRCINEIRTFFVDDERQCVFETVGVNGEFIDHFDGRILTPGHSIEAAWFILHEARVRGGDRDLIALGCKMLEWMWTRGWDREYGGILYFVDVNGLPVQEYWHDMKFWWPHNETIIATLLAHYLTGEERYAAMHRQVHAWAYAHFPDGEYGEWYGYLHRDGRVSAPLKGNTWKGAFHLPRMQWYCWRLLEAEGWH
ncbi:MAG: AGE family epimerase/isomerase [Candidatus Hydrogenedentes bacterium]|nr:AGE family epimerase/isomerase [Candidatus Hydrogenedentota bacterium]